MNASAMHTFAILGYKESPYLEECVLSLKRQTVKSDMYISAAEPSRFLHAIAQKYNIPLIVSANSKGIGYDWSAAYGLCKTKYLTLAHQDDIYLPEYTASCLNEANKAKGQDVIIFTDYYEHFYDTVLAYTGNLLIKKSALSIFFTKNHLYSKSAKKCLVYFGNPISCPTVMYNKEIIGDFRFSDNFSCSLDWDAWIRLAKKDGGFCYIRKKLLIHRIYEQSQSYIMTQKRLRKKEETAVLEGIWPRPVAEVISHINFLCSLLNTPKIQNYPLR